MPKFTVRAHKTIYAPANIEVEADTLKEAATLGLSRLQQDYPNCKDHAVFDVEVRNVAHPNVKRTIAIGGCGRA